MRPATTPDPIDVRFGKLLRMVRNTRGLSQGELGAMNGLTFQQIQKYERGLNRVSISRFMHMANSLGVPATWFIKKLNGTVTQQPGSEIDANILDRREVQSLLRAYASIENKADRQTMYRVMAIVAARNGCFVRENAENRREK